MHAKSQNNAKAKYLSNDFFILMTVFDKFFHFHVV